MLQRITPYLSLQPKRRIVALDEALFGASAILLDQLTFPAALVSYAVLTLGVLLSAFGRCPSIGWKVVAFLTVAHVFLVWKQRYHWDIDQATRNGYTGFLIFHASLCLIIATAFLPHKRTLFVARLAFVAVTFGALGAVFRYDDAAPFRIPVILCAVAGTIGLLAAFRRNVVPKKPPTQ